MTNLEPKQPNILDYLSVENAQTFFNLENSRDFKEYQKAVKNYKTSVLAKSARKFLDLAIGILDGHTEPGETTAEQLLSEAGKSLIVASEDLGSIAFQESLEELGRGLERHFWDKAKSDNLVETIRE